MPFDIYPEVDEADEENKESNEEVHSDKDEAAPQKSNMNKKDKPKPEISYISMGDSESDTNQAETVTKKYEK